MGSHKQHFPPAPSQSQLNLSVTMNLLSLLSPRPAPVAEEAGQARMNFFDLANLLDNDGNLQNEMMVGAFAATMLATIPVLLGNEFDVNVGLRKKKKRSVEEEEEEEMVAASRTMSSKYNRIIGSHR